MNKTYIYTPLAALVVFTGVYLNFQSGYKAKEAAHQAQIEAAKKTKLDAEIAARRKAIDDAVRAQEVRKKEREAKEAAEAARQAARQTALDAREKAFHEQEKNARLVERLKQDIAAEKETAAKLAQDRASSLAEQAFLKTYVRQAEANVQALGDVLQKIAAAEAARQAAAEAAKKNS